jgi:signal transduction histidine kinase/CheY-like chemotaxis protein
MAGYETLNTELVSWITTILMLGTLILAVNMRARARDPCTFKGLAYILAANLILFFSSITPAFDSFLSDFVFKLSLAIGMHAVIVLGFAGILRGMGRAVSLLWILPVSTVIIGLQIGAAHAQALPQTHVLIAALGNGILAAIFAVLLARAVASFSRELILLVAMPFVTISLVYALRLGSVVLALPNHLLAFGILFTGLVLTFALMVWCFTLQTFGNVRLAQSLSAERARAQEANKMKSRFLANMSHEIRTPLNGVLGMAQVLDDGRLENDQREMVRIIIDSGETLLKLLDDILDLSKVEAGKLELEQVPFVPRELIRGCAKLHALRAKAQGITLTVELGTGLNGVWLGDRHRLTQVLNNLLNNAIKFTPEGEVRIVADITPRPAQSEQADSQGWMLEISVTDTGIGMHPDQVSRIFADFTQANETISRQFGGTGLGLSISHKLLELMGGGVRVESREGEGSSFHIWLPTQRWTEPVAKLLGTEMAEHADLETAARPPNDMPQPELAGLRILLAEDNKTNQRVIAAMLRKTGVELVIVDNGRHAVELDAAIAAGALPDFDIFLFDIQMPEMDGPDAFAVIQKNRHAQGRPLARAAALTANALPEQRAEYLQAGFVECLSKPIQNKRLVAFLKQFVRSSARNASSGEM